MVVNLRAKKRLVSRVTGVGVHRIHFDSDHLDDIADAITRDNIRSLITANTIRIKKIVGRVLDKNQSKNEKIKKEKIKLGKASGFWDIFSGGIFS